MDSTPSQCAHMESETYCIPTPNAVLRGDILTAFRSSVSWVCEGRSRAGRGLVSPRRAGGPQSPAGHSPNRHGELTGKGAFRVEIMSSGIVGRWSSEGIC